VNAREVIVKQFATLLLSAVVSVGLLEAGLRIFTPHPIHFSSNIVSDPRLGHKMSPSLSGIDAAGFRNEQVPSRAEIVALGDSQTYGFNVQPEQSWPRRLGEMMDTTVYNFGVGRYGIVEYDLLLDAALELEPDIVILGLYLANDLFGTVRSLGEPHGRAWARESGLTTPAAVGSEGVPRAEKGDSSSPTAIGSLLGAWTRPESPGVEISLAGGRTRIATARINSHAANMDLREPGIARAFEIAKRVIAGAARRTRAAGVDFIVLFIPSKERIYYDAFVESGTSLPSAYHQLVKREDALGRELKDAMTQLDVAVVDPLPDLERAVRSRSDVYPERDDGHPLAAGYELYARSVYEHLIAAPPAPAP
jgi:lysophospholipase L1-like esterase